MTEDTETNEGRKPGAAPPPMTFVYSNAVGMRGGAFDLSLEFGYSVPPGGGEDPQPTEWKVRVGMSWEHAQAMYELLGTQIARYEEQVGSIPDISKLKQGGPA